MSNKKYSEILNANAALICKTARMLVNAKLAKDETRAASLEKQLLAQQAELSANLDLAYGPPTDHTKEWPSHR